LDVFLHVERQLRRRFVYEVQQLGDLSLELFLQFGYGMMEHCRFLIREWAGGTVILSPRDLNEDQLLRLSTEISDLGGSVLLDPQLYQVDANHSRLVAQKYWPTKDLIGAELRRCISELFTLNEEIGAKQIILPGQLAAKVDDDWLAAQSLVIEEAQRQNRLELEEIATVALTAEALKDDDQVQTLIEGVGNWNVPAVYLVCEPPNGDYLVQDASWLANYVDVVAGLRLVGQRVIAGYCNHQMLVAASAERMQYRQALDERSLFSLRKFRSQDEDDVKQRATWYYAPHLLSEYKIPTLDLAQKNGVLGKLETPQSYGSQFSDALFSARQPSLAAFTEQQAFRHYLQCLKAQAESATATTFEQTIAQHRTALDQAEKLLKDVRRVAVVGGNRDFFDALEANRGALAFLELNRAPLLRRNWKNLI